MKKKIVAIALMFLAFNEVKAQSFKVDYNDGVPVEVIDLGTHYMKLMLVYDPMRKGDFIVVKDGVVVQGYDLGDGNYRFISLVKK